MIFGKTNKNRGRRLISAVVAFFAVVAFSAVASGGAPTWPAVTNETRPWVYNWWMGSAVDEAGLEAQCRALAEQGFGGFHVIPIYGAKGHEAAFKTFLGEDWIRAFAAAVRIGRAHGLGVDLTTGSGWCFGGPQLAREQGCWTLAKTKDGLSPRVEPVLTGQQVKRAGPGGRGPMMDPYSVEAMAAFLKPFTDAFDRPGVAKPLRLYHDSWEYFGAGWTPDFPRLFRAKRGYDLTDRWTAFAGGPGDVETRRRLKHDYRETLSDLVVEDVFPTWVDWCHARGIETRNEAHGSVANWLDFYDLADYPETEMYGFFDRDILVSKFASSSAHLGGKAWTSAESCTWLNDHFRETPLDYKRFLDRLLLAGVDKVYYHGLCYSPTDAVWPGWCFYASSETNPRNPLWRDFGFLNAYVTRVQSISRATACDDDLLVYWPIHDFWRNPEGFALPMTVHNRTTWFDALPFGRIARTLFDAGVSFDYVSDRQLQKLRFGHGAHRRILVPAAQTLPLATARRLFALADAGFEVVFAESYPDETPGFLNHDAETRDLRALFAKGHPRVSRRGVLDLAQGLRVEPFTAVRGLAAWRRADADGRAYYFVVNGGAAPVAEDLKVSAPCGAAWEMDPLTGAVRGARTADGRVRVRLGPWGSSVYVVSATSDPASAVAPERPCGTRLDLAGDWTLTPVCGGPVLPKPRTMRTLTSWSRTETGAEEPFCGTMRYALRFAAHADSGAAVLDLGDVRHSARVCLNGRDLGCRFMPPYRFDVPTDVLAAENELVVDVTNTGANRLRWNDRTGVKWKYFEDANMRSVEGTCGGAGVLDAATWPLEDAGLLGPVRLFTQKP